MRQAVSAWISAGVGARPQDSSTRAHKARRKPKHQQFSRGVEVRSGVGEGAQIGEAHRERKAEFLRFGSAGGMDDAGVRRHGSARKAGLGGALGAQRETLGALALGALAPRRRRESVPKLRAQRIEAEGNTGERGLDVILVDQPHDRLGGVRRARRIFDHHRDAVVQPNLVQDMRQRGVAVVFKRRAIGALRAGENKMQTVGAALEIFERLDVGGVQVGGVQVGEVDAGENGPAAWIYAQSARAGRLGAPIERVNRRAVVGLGDEPLESSAFQRAFDAFAPLVFTRLGKTSRQRVML